MKLSNKLLLGGFFIPVVFVIIFVVFMSINSTEDRIYQFGKGISMHNEIIK